MFVQYVLVIYYNANGVQFIHLALFYACTNKTLCIWWLACFDKSDIYILEVSTRSKLTPFGAITIYVSDVVC